MPRIQILAGPDRLAFMHSLFTEIDADPYPGYLPPPHSRGGVKSPTFRGETFLTENEKGEKRELLLIITDTKRVNRSGMAQEFTAFLWAACEDFRDMIAVEHMTCWIQFKGMLDFTTQSGWLERVESHG
ncbi:MAG: hypothetical protein WCV85_04070 [Patescibacteria group bacterium]|jgi:hypothetical protein